MSTVILGRTIGPALRATVAPWVEPATLAACALVLTAATHAAMLSLAALPAAAALPVLPAIAALAWFRARRLRFGHNNPSRRWGST